MSVQINIVTCPQWDARSPAAPLDYISKAPGIIFHHTATHHAEIDGTAGDSLAEAKRYARDIQAYHMDRNGWNDSGHNFLVTRSGHILQGRWGTVTAIQMGRMVHSAHCPGKNTWIGIEHEHKGTETMTKAQREASARLQAWIAAMYRKTKVLPVDPHKQYFATACPGNLVSEIEPIRRIAQEILLGKF